MVSPFAVEFMIACHVSADPPRHIGAERWNSIAGKKIWAWLCREGLIDGQSRATPKGVAWVGYICSVPLPVEQWVLPEAERETFKSRVVSIAEGEPII